MCVLMCWGLLRVNAHVDVCVCRKLGLNQGLRLTTYGWLNSLLDIFPAKWGC